jgi:PPP family 3-phenylpropionic acid transporter
VNKPTRGTLALRLYYVAAFGVVGLYLPFFPRWIEARGMLGIRLGIIAAVAPATGVFAPPLLGALADALRLREALLQVACAGALLTFGALAVAAAAGLSLGFGTLFAATLAFALFRSPMGFMADVVAIELAPAAHTTYGRLRLWGSLGFIAAVIPGALYVDPRDAVVFPAATAALVFVALLASLRLPRRAEMPTAVPGRGAWRLLGARDVQLFLLTAFLGQFGHVAYDLCFSIRLFDLGVSRATVGVTWAVGTASEVLLMACAAPLFRAFLPASLFAFALATASARWAMIAVVRSSAVLLALQPLHAISFGLAWLASVSYVSRRFPPHSLGSAQGFFCTAVGLGSAAGMVTWGWVYQHAGGAMVFAGAASFSACACAVAILSGGTRPVGARFHAGSDSKNSSSM